MNIKVIILAGGWGTRLGQLGELVPKPMVNIGNKPILWHIMKIYSHYGFNDFIISAGVKSHIIKNYFMNYDVYSKNFSKDFSTGEVIYENLSDKVDWQVSVVDTGLNTLKGARIKRLSKYLDEETNMLTYGDGIADINLTELLDYHNSHGKTVTISGVHPPARFGELIEKDGKVISFEEKPQTSVGLINGGFMVFNRKLLDYLSTDEQCDLEFGTLEKLTEEGEVMVYKHLGNWECVDNERDVIHLSKLWDNNQAFWKVWD